ncbi:hypothetical protein LLH06_10840 [Mucilaginibacter daejeonensis]|uniref:DUF6625 family protein n=1 Tax=Mucilaginibacter daejeonensis TaxID=398049 RepID=UPI001D179FA6|nr:DUF6625 family protein [Mucilaginibacter daejeonensis]UEG51470.1 hypothetical protein LLH06_10840 [Mucilaginibacter daejeonensis]
MIFKHRTIAFIICYYGPFPWYFKYFIKSCTFNPSVDFFIVTDNIQTHEVTPNVKFINLSLDDVKNLIEQKLGYSVSLSYPYKLCDFKPTYGLVFWDWIKEYDFWGHCDIDIIFGNIRNFITDGHLDQYDLISVRHDFITGYFLLFRNNTNLRTLFKKSKDHKKVHQSSIYFNFDETNYAHNKMIDEDKSFEEVTTEIESMMHVIKKKDNAINAYFDTHILEGTPGKLKWEAGELVFANRYEILLYHLIHFKRSSKEKDNLGKPSDTFKVSSTRIYR